MYPRDKKALNMKTSFPLLGLSFLFFKIFCTNFYSYNLMRKTLINLPGLQNGLNIPSWVLYFKKFQLKAKKQILKYLFAQAALPIHSWRHKDPILSYWNRNRGWQNCWLTSYFSFSTSSFNSSFLSMHFPWLFLNLMILNNSGALPRQFWVFEFIWDFPGPHSSSFCKLANHHIKQLVSASLMKLTTWVQDLYAAVTPSYFHWA